MNTEAALRVASFSFNLARPLGVQTRLESAPRVPPCRYIEGPLQRTFQRCCSQGYNLRRWSKEPAIGAWICVARKFLTDLFRRPTSVLLIIHRREIRVILVDNYDYVFQQTV